MELSGKRKRRSQKKRYMDVVKEDMAEVEVTEKLGITGDGKSAVVTPDWKSRKKKKNTKKKICLTT